MSGPDPSPVGPAPDLRNEPPQSGDSESFATRLAIAQKAGGLVVPLLTTVLAFLIGGLVVLATTGKNPLNTYKAIFEGAGFNWFFEVGSYELRIPFTEAHIWFPWNVNDFESLAAVNLQQTLIVWVGLVFTGLAVAFAFRCGMFNIGGQGQYLVGSIMGVWVGSSLPQLPGFLHIVAAIVAGGLAGAAWAGIAGLLKATVGAHEVISTIMLNWIAIWVGVFLFGLGGPLQNDTQEFVPVSNDVLDESKLKVFWGDPLLQGLHVGFFLALAALVVYWIVLNRTTLGYEVRAVGLQPRGGSLRRHLRGEELLPGDGDLRHVRGTRRRDRHRRLAVQDQHQRRAPRHDGLHRNRCRAPGAKHGGRRRAVCAPVRRAHRRHVDS